MIEEIKKIWQIYRESKQFVAFERKILIFPAISSTLSFAGFAGAVYISTLIAMNAMNKFQNMRDFLWQNAMLIGCLLLIYFSTTILKGVCKNAFFSEVINAEKDTSVSIMRGFHTAFNQIKSIFLWEIVNSTVGVVISLFESCSRTKTEAVIVSGSTDAAWKTLSYFVHPEIVCNKKTANPFKHLSASCGILKKTPVSVIGGILGFGSLMTVITMVWVCVVFAAIWISSRFQDNLITIICATITGIGLILLIVLGFLLNAVRMVYTAKVFISAR